MTEGTLWKSQILSLLEEIKTTRRIIQIRMQIQCLCLIWLYVGASNCLAFLKILCCLSVLQCCTSVILRLLQF